MDRADLTELHYITPIANVASICRMGILSHARAQAVNHVSVAMPEIQGRRANVRVPGGRPLHEYVNLYICARNPMMYRRSDRHQELCVLRVSTHVLDLPGVVVVSGNASSGYVRFGAGAAGLALVDRVLTFAEYWTDPDPITYYEKKSAKCAEVLVPDVVQPSYLLGAYVSDAVGLAALNALSLAIPVQVNAHLFFR
ncbi:MAG TPA: DUF4433 domain-containing protein [Gemmatimonadales bacterium]|nr:DUF4433 domain-containing protein [Gemmatimonadales bacterium]